MDKENKEHPWHKRSTFSKRIHGFYCYQMASFCALVWPVQVDRAMYVCLRDQFVTNDKEPTKRNDEKSFD